MVVGVTDAGCVHQPTVVGGRKPKELPMFHWVNTLLGNVKSSLSGAHHAFGYSHYAERYRGAIVYRFNRRFDLHACLTDCWWPRWLPARAQNAGFG